MEDFRKMVQNALFNTNNEERASNEKKVSELCTQNPSKFLQYSVFELSNETADAGMRQGCGTLFVRALKMPGKNSAAVWLELDENEKSQIKTALMVTLVTHVLPARRAAASGIAAICSLELPLKQWPQIIPVLTNNSQNSDTEVKKAALLTLGFICEELKLTGNANCIDKTQIEGILMGILIGMAENETNLEIREISIKACHDSLAFMEQLLQRKDIRDYLMKCIFFSLNVDNRAVRIKAAQCLIDFSKIYYSKLDEYILSFVDILGPLTLHQDEEVAIPAIEVFNTIAIEDKERDSTKQFNNVQQVNASLLFTKAIYQKIIPFLLKNLIREPSSSEDGELSIHDTATKCLTSVVEVIGDETLDLLKEFISSTIGAEFWVHRHASLIAFSCLLEGPSKNNVESMITLALDNIVGLLQDKHERVRIQSAVTINRISEIYPLSILNHQNFAKFIQMLAFNLKSKPKISRNICWAMNFLADGIPSIENQNHPIFQNADLILEHLVKNTIRSDLPSSDSNVIDITFMAIMNLLHYLAIPEISLKYLVNFIDQFKNTYTLHPGPAKVSLQTGLLSTMHTALLRIPSLDENLGLSVYNLVIEDFKIRKEVTSDGIYAISALTAAWKKGFIERLDEFWNFLLFALGKQEDLEIFKSAIGCMADISRSCEGAFNRFLPQVVPALLKCLHSPDINREVKLHVFLCLGDIALGSKTAMIPFLEDIKKIFDIAFTAAVEISRDPDSQEYAEQLKEKLVEAYICIIHSLGEENEAKQSLLSHFPNLFAFLIQVTKNELNPTVEFLRNVLALIADIANFFKGDVRNFVKTQFAQDIINTLQRFSHIKENELIIKYAVHVISGC